MDRNLKLNSLFNEWQNATPEYTEQFIKDGVIDEEQFEEQKPKLLFITKEANASSNKSWDFRDNWHQELLYRFDYRIAEWAYGIQNNFPEFDSIYQNKNEYSNAIKKVAFMDVKKSSGGSQCDNGLLLQNIKENLSFLHRQIDIIEPDIIISSLMDYDTVTMLFPGIEFKKSGYIRCVAKWRNYKIIDFYHPSSQTVPAASYSLLQNIYQSNAFKSL
ncbi:MAG: hypothetical protein ABIN67_10390 [Ferruginibacter sp.]